MGIFSSSEIYLKNVGEFLHTKPMLNSTVIPVIFSTVIVDFGS